MPDNEGYEEPTVLEPGDIPPNHAYYTGFNYIRYHEMTVPVRCEAVAPPEVPVDKGTPVPNQDFEVESVKIFMSTFSGAFSYPDEDTQCQRGRILTRVRTNKAGPVFVRLFTKGHDNITHSEYIPAWSFSVGSGVYEAEIERWMETDVSSSIFARVEVENDGYEHLNDGWEILPLQCVTNTPDFRNPFNDDGGDDGEIGWQTAPPSPFPPQRENGPDRFKRD